MHPKSEQEPNPVQGDWDRRPATANDLATASPLMRLRPFTLPLMIIGGPGSLTSQPLSPLAGNGPAGWWGLMPARMMSRCCAQADVRCILTSRAPPAVARAMTIETLKLLTGGLVGFPPQGASLLFPGQGSSGRVLVSAQARCLQSGHGRASGCRWLMRRRACCIERVGRVGETGSLPGFCLLDGPHQGTTPIECQPDRDTFSSDVYWNLTLWNAFVDFMFIAIMISSNGTSNAGQ